MDNLSLHFASSSSKQQEVSFDILLPAHQCFQDRDGIFIRSPFYHCWAGLSTGRLIEPSRLKSGQNAASFPRAEPEAWKNSSPLGY